jgi:hypothetical protein
MKGILKRTVNKFGENFNFQTAYYVFSSGYQIKNLSITAKMGLLTMFF